MQQPIYKVRAHTYKNKKTVSSTDGLEIPLSSATSDQTGANAGELLAMSLSACLSSTLKTVLAAHQQKIDYHIKVIHEVYREENKHDGYYFTYHSIFHLYDLSEPLCNKYVEMTKKLCPISKALHHHRYYTSEIKCNT